MAACGEESNPLPFSPYEKMPTDTNCWTSRKLDAVKKWVALEKIHGANFSFSAHATGSGVGSETGPVLAAKRSGFLKPEENFFKINKQPQVIAEGAERTGKLFEAVRKEQKDASAVTVFGELFGGSYPHPLVSAVRGVVPIQAEVLYCPGLKFIAYDIALIRSSGRIYLDYDVCMQLFKDAGFLYLEPLITGTLQDMLCFELGFETTLPAQLGLPPLAQEGRRNVAEGIVVKPLKNLILETDKGERRRVIFKRKVENFHECKPRRQKHTKSKGKDFSKSEADRELLHYEMSALTTDQRVVNTVSKRGVPEMEEEWEELVEEVVADIVESVSTENEALWLVCGGSVGSVVGEVKRECRELVDQYRLRHAMAESRLT